VNDTRPPVRDSIITTLSLYPSLATSSLVAIEVNHRYTRDEVLDELALMIIEQLVTLDGGSIRLVKQIPEEPIPAEFLAKVDAYRRTRNPTGYDRVTVFVANVWARVTSWCDKFIGRILGGLACLIATMFFAIGLCASERPEWALPGILDRESSSRYTEAGAVVYVDQAVGAAGELGPFQMRRDAFDQVAESGEVFERLGHDTAFAERLAIRYLDWLHLRSKRDWFIAVGRWNAGPHGDYGVAWRYAKDVQRRGRQAQTR
jgi:hypothetical protein